MHTRHLTLTLIMIFAAALLATSCGDDTASTDDDTVQPASDTTSTDATDDSAAPLDTTGDTVGGDGATTDTQSDTAEPSEMDPTLEASLQHVLDEYVYFTGETGVMLTVKQSGEQMATFTSGLSFVQESTPLTADNLFRVGSNTKPITVTLTLMVAEAGLIDIDAPFTDYLPQYDRWDGVTVRQLMDMQSGLPDYLVSEAMLTQVVLDPSVSFTREDLVGFALDMEDAFVPGEKTVYNNTNTVLLAMIVEAVTGNSYVDELQSRILDPLGMDRTFLDTTDEEIDGLAHGYINLDIVGPMFAMPSTLKYLLPQELLIDDATIDATYLFPATIAWAAGAIVSDTEDMVTFMEALQTGELVSQETLDEMLQLSPMELLGGLTDYGMGIMRFPSMFGDTYGHEGLHFGYHSGTFYVPSEDLTISHLHNSLPMMSPELVRSVYALVDEQPTEEYQVCEAPAGLPEAPTADGLVFRFKGPINAAGLDDPLTGAAHALGMLDGTDAYLYGFGPWAERATLAGEPAVTISLVGPYPGDDLKYRVTTITLADTLLDALDEDGTVTVESDELGSLATWSVVILDVDDETSANKSICIEAVATADPGLVASCVTGADAFQEGSIAKLHGHLGLTTDTTAVEAYAVAMGTATCVCFDDAGLPTACPDPAE